MIRTALIDQLEAIEWSEASIDLHQMLTSFSASDEAAAVILIAAATLLARQHPFASEDDELMLLCADFDDLVFAVRKNMPIPDDRPKLHIVGGTDVN